MHWINIINIIRIHIKIQTLFFIKIYIRRCLSLIKLATQWSSIKYWRIQIWSNNQNIPCLYQLWQGKWHSRYHQIWRSFINESQLIAISKSGRTTSSDDVQNFLYAKERGIEVHLFVRKNKDDKTSKEFYYLGHMQAEIDKTKQFVMPNTQKTAVEILWQLDTPVREDIYRYIVEEWFFENNTRSSCHY